MTKRGQPEPEEFEDDSEFEEILEEEEDVELEEPEEEEAEPEPEPVKRGPGKGAHLIGKGGPGRPKNAPVKRLETGPVRVVMEFSSDDLSAIRRVFNILSQK